MIARSSDPATGAQRETGPSERSGCRRCGSPYRPPRWGREYLCGACGRPLRPRRRKISLPLPLVCAGLLMGLAALVVRVGAERVVASAARSVAREAEPRSITL